MCSCTLQSSHGDESGDGDSIGATDQVLNQDQVTPSNTSEESSNDMVTE